MMSRHGAPPLRNQRTDPRSPFSNGFATLLVLLTWAAIGCQSTKPPGSSESVGIDKKRKPEPVMVRGLDASVGRVESVRGELRLVVLDYSLSTLPQLGDMLEAAREGNAVGVIKVTGPFRPGTGKLGGEIVSGDVQVGDTVRAQSR